MTNATNLANAWLAIREAARTHLFDPNVSLIDVGFPVRDGMESEELAVRFHVHRKLFDFELETAIRGGVTTSVPSSVGVFGRMFLKRGFFRTWPARRPFASGTHVPDDKIPCPAELVSQILAITITGRWAR